MSNTIDLSIIILNYKMDGLVKHCLKSIFSHEHRVQFEVIVVDNASGDQCESIVKNQFPRARFIQTGANWGHAKGNNIGIQESRGRYVMILNPDTVFIQPVLDELIAALDADTGVGIATVQLRNPDGTLQSGAWRFPTLFDPLFQRIGFLHRSPRGQKAVHTYEMRDWNRQTHRDVDWVQGSCLTIRRATMEDIGTLDEQLFLYFTDVDWCRRAWESGWRVRYFASPSLVHYFHRESAEASGWRIVFNKVSRIHIKDWFRYLQKYRGRSHPRST